MTFTNIISVSSEDQTQPIKTHGGQNAKLVNVKIGGTYIYHKVIKR
jgi:hypothetical protein